MAVVSSYREDLG